MLFIIGWLFYESVWAMIICLPMGTIYFFRWERSRVEDKRREFRSQFQEALQSVSASLNVGYSLENAMKETRKDLELLYNEDTLIMKELHYMVRQLYVQIPVDVVLEEWACRMQIEEVKSFASVCALAKKNGGNMVMIIRSSISKIREELEIRREIETILAAKKYEFKIMTMIPMGIIGYMRVSFPEFMKILYGNILGVGVMSVCLGVYICAYLLGEKIISIEI